MDITSKVHGNKKLPAGATLTLLPFTPNAVARAVAMTAGLTGGPWSMNGTRVTIGPFSVSGVVNVECIDGDVGISITPAVQSEFAVFNAAVDGATDDSAAVLAMNTALGYVKFPRGATRISTNTTITGNAVFDAGAYVTVDAGVTLTIYGYVESLRQFIFRGAGSVVLGGPTAGIVGSQAREAHAEWFGLVVGSSSDQTPALQLAVNAMSNLREGIIYLPLGNITANIFALTLNRGIKLIGKGSRRTVFTATPDGVTGFVTNGIAGWIEGISIEAAAGTYKNGGPTINVGHDYWTLKDIGLPAATEGIQINANNCKVEGILAAVAPSALVAGSYVVNVRGSDCTVRDVRGLGSALFLESLVKVSTNGTDIARVTIEKVDSTVGSATAVNIQATANKIDEVTVDGVLQNAAGGTGVSISNTGAITIQDFVVSNVQVGSTAAAAVSISNSGSGNILKPMLSGVIARTGATAGIVLSQTAGTIQGVKIGQCDLSGATTPLSITGSVIPQVDPRTQTVRRTAAQTFSQTIANNGVFTFATGVQLFGAQVLVTLGVTDWGLYVMRAASSPSTTPILGTPSANMANTTGVLTGTTGTAGKFTVSTDASGNLYFENRLGASTLAQITVMTGVPTPVL